MLVPCLLVRLNVLTSRHSTQDLEVGVFGVVILDIPVDKVGDEGVQQDDEDGSKGVHEEKELPAIGHPLGK